MRFILLVVLVSGPAFAHADVLDDWNDAVLNAIRRENTPPPLAARNLAILHLAIYEVVNAIERTSNSDLHMNLLSPSLSSAPSGGEGARRAGEEALRGSGEQTTSLGGSWNLSPWRGEGALVLAPSASQPQPLNHSLVSAEVAAGAAAFRVTGALFPSQRATFEQLWKATEARARTEAELTNSLALGFTAAEAMLQLCASDTAHTTVAYIPSAKPGAWRRTPPYYRPPDLPQWGCLKPFALASCDQFRPPPPPALDSRRYAEDLNEVKRLGGKNSTERTPYETETARFWSDFSGTVTPPGHWNQIARSLAQYEKLPLADKARLLALLNVALSDAGVVCWEAKFKYNLWRPVTAIQSADEDGNGETVRDADWLPLLITPAFPEYVSGHSTFSGAAGEVLARFFGRDNFDFSVTSDTLPDVVRHYQSIAAVVTEIGRSRILGGIHFPSADENGQVAGRAVGRHISEQGLQPRQVTMRRP